MTALQESAEDDQRGGLKTSPSRHFLRKSHQLNASLNSKAILDFGKGKPSPRLPGLGNTDSRCYNNSHNIHNPVLGKERKEEDDTGRSGYQEIRASANALSHRIP